MGRFEGKVALIMGASEGIGQSTAEAFAKDGAKVVLTARRQPEGEAVAESIRRSGGDALFVQGDVSKAEQVRQMVASTIDTYSRLDYACNNAGVFSEPALIADTTEEDWDYVMDVNLKGVWLSMKYQIPEMLKVGGGAIVNISSGNGLIAGAKTSIYTASKHGVVGLTKAAALDYAQDNIRVNTLCLGSVHTPMHDRIWTDAPEALEFVGNLHPVGRIASSEEIASAVLWLCSDASSYMTGFPLAMDGGWLAR